MPSTSPTAHYTRPINPFSADHAYRPISANRAVRLMKRVDPGLCVIRKGIYGRVLPRLGHEVRLDIDGASYWLCNEAGTYYFKHPDYRRGELK